MMSAPNLFQHWSDPFTGWFHSLVEYQRP